MSADFFESAKKMLVFDEGLRLKPYKCTAGYLTIGIGRNLDSNGITEETAYQMLREDVEDAYLSAEKIFGEAYFESLSDPRKLAIINMIFNLGEVGFRQFAPTIALMRAGRWSEAAARILKSRYATQVKSRVNRVASMLRDDKFPY